MKESLLIDSDGSIVDHTYMKKLERQRDSFRERERKSKSKQKSKKERGKEKTLKLKLLKPSSSPNLSSLHTTKTEEERHEDYSIKLYNQSNKKPRWCFISERERERERLREGHMACEQQLC